MKFRSTVLASALAIAALAVTAQASASCKHPKAPEKIPDDQGHQGRNAGGHEDHAPYNDLVAKYTECLQADHDAAVAKIDPSIDDKKKADQKAELDKVQQQKNDAAVDEAEMVTARFNDQIKAFKAAHTN